MPFQLTTQHLILRDFNPEDQAAYQAFTSDKKYQRFYSEEDCHPDKASTLVNQFVSESKLTDRKSYNLAIIDKHSEQLIGVCGTRLEAQGQASMGCGLSRQHHSSGIAKEATSCLIEFAFTQLGCHRLYAETISENKAAIRLCQAMGMRHEATFLENRFFKQRWWSTSVLALLQHEWHMPSANQA